MLLSHVGENCSDDTTSLMKGDILMGQISLEFLEGQECSLNSVRFSHSLLSRDQISYRGKGGNRIFGDYSFQWSPAVRAMSILLLWTKGGYINPFTRYPFSMTTLSGAQGTYAASLDYALSKKPLWLLDMFGVDSSGEAIARRIFIRGNSERKRGGEVVIAINTVHVPASSIEVVCNGKLLNGLESVTLGHILAQKPKSTKALEMEESKISACVNYTR
jgi:hypothetical protein